MTTGKLKNSRGHSIDFHLGVAIDAGDHAPGLLHERITRCVDEIASNVVNTTAAALHLVADVRRIHIVVTEEASDRAELPHAPFVKQCAQAKPLVITRIMNASQIFTPVRARTSSRVFASATVRPIGFSQSTCFPASAALIVGECETGWAEDCK